MCLSFIREVHADLMCMEANIYNVDVLKSGICANYCTLHNINIRVGRRICLVLCLQIRVQMVHFLTTCIKRKNVGFATC